MRSRGKKFRDQSRKSRFQWREQSGASLRNRASLTARSRWHRRFSPRHFSRSPPRRLHYDEPEDRHLYGPSGLQSRNLPLPPPLGRDSRKRTELDDEPRKNHGVEPRAKSEVFNRRSWRSYGSGGKERMQERKRNSRMVSTSRPQEWTVSPRRHPAYLRESRQQPAILLRAYDGLQERTPPTWRPPLLCKRGLSCRQGSMGQEARHAPPNKPRHTPLLSARNLTREGQLHHSMEGGHPTHMPNPPNDQSTNHKPSYTEVVALDIREKLDKTTTLGRWQHVHRRLHPTSK